MEPDPLPTSLLFPAALTYFFFSAAGSLPDEGAGIGQQLRWVGEGCQVLPSPTGGVTSLTPHLTLPQGCDAVDA